MNQETEAQSSDASGKTPAPWGVKMLMAAGLLLLYSGVVAIAAGAYYTFSMKDYARPNLYQYLPEILPYTVGLFSALLGVRLIRAAGISPSDPLPVVNPTEWLVLAKAIERKGDDPIGEYIRLSSLTGMTGIFTKLGLSGLPLATIGLTLFFAMCSLFAPKDSGFYDLTQLTLGAFIGSFVQKQVTAVRDSGDTAVRATRSRGPEAGGVGSAESTP